MKMLEVIDRLSGLGIMNVVPTFLPLHAIPKGSTDRSYVHEVVEKILPKFVGKAGFVDSFCDKGAFSPESTAEFFRSAKEMGFQLRDCREEMRT